MTDGPQVHVEANYLTIATAFAEGNDDTEPQWQSLSDVLADRPGWRFAIFQSDEGLSASWCFGDHGSSLLVVDGEMEGFRIFDYSADRSHVEPSLAGFLNYIAGRETELDREHYNTAVEWRAAIRRIQDDQRSTA